MTPLRVWIGFDPREKTAYKVCEASLRKHSSIPLQIQPLVLEHMRWRELYKRPTSYKDGRLWDEISQAPMATEFALTRFLIPALQEWKGMALFCDCDFLWREDVAALLDEAKSDFALQCVVQRHVDNSQVKMDGQTQTNYARKNWSSLMLWNCEHLMHAGQVERVNRWPGLWLHQFRWLDVLSLGALSAAWNVLDNGEPPMIEPFAYHYTRGTPDMRGYENTPFADEWRSYA